MSQRLACGLAALLTVLCTPLLAWSRQDSPVPPEVETIVLAFEAEDGTPLEGKLTLPAVRAAPPPVVFYLHGAGPRSYDNPFRYVDDEGSPQIGFYLDFHARELARRGIAFFRMSKRGCRAFPEPPWMRLDREVFAAATPSILLEDYVRGLDSLRQREELDMQRIVLLGSSEGTWMAPRLARARPSGIVGLVLTGYAADGLRETVVWQNSIGPWRNIQHLLPDASDGTLTREEFDRACAADASIARSVPFAVFDKDGDASVTPDEVRQVLRPRLDMILKAVEQGDDEFLWNHSGNVSAVYLKDWWEVRPTHELLLQVDLPMAIFHGDLDGTCRVEGAREAEEAFRAAGKANLSVQVFPGLDHDLDWSWQRARDGALPAYEEVFDRIAGMARPAGD